MIFSDADAYMGLPPPKYGPNATFMKIDYFSRNTDVLRCGFNDVYKNLLEIYFFKKKSMKKWFEPMNKNDFSRRISLCHRFFHISPQMMSYIDFSKKNWKIDFSKIGFLKSDFLNRFFKSVFKSIFKKSIFKFIFKSIF